MYYLPSYPTGSLHLHHATVPRQFSVPWTRWRQLDHDASFDRAKHHILRRASAWIYAVAYDDAGGQKVKLSVLDLTSEPYGMKGNFNVAMWVLVKKGARDGDSRYLVLCFPFIALP